MLHGSEVRRTSDAAVAWRFVGCWRWGRGCRDVVNGRAVATRSERSSSLRCGELIELGEDNVVGSSLEKMMCGRRSCLS